MHRGAAFADFDRDGRIDAVVTKIGEPPLLLRNMAGAGNHWLELQLTGTRSNRDAIGARVRIVTEAGEQWNHVTTSVGYASSSDKSVHFGLGGQNEVKEIEITWPSGRVQRVGKTAADRYVQLTEPRP